MIVQYKLLGSSCEPVNKSEISIEVNHDQESVVNQPRPHVGINNLFFAREDISKIMNYLSSISESGITEGVPFDIEITERGQTEIINMYLNLMDGFKRSNEGLSASVKMLQSLEWLDDRMDGFTLESMYNETGVTQFKIDGVTYTSYQQFLDRKCIYIPYVISTTPEKQAAFMALLSVVFICIQIYRAIKDIVEAAEVFWQLVAEIPFVIALLFTLFALIEKMVNYLIQPLKYHGAMLLVDMLKLVSVKMGLEFNSSIWEIAPLNQVAYLPEKYNPPTLEGTPLTLMKDFSLPGIKGIGSENVRNEIVGGYTAPARAPLTSHDSNTPNIQHGYMNGTGGDLLRLAKTFCNGKIIIPDQTNELKLERRDYFPTSSSYQLQNIRQDWNGYNTDELSSNTLIEFESDLNDKNCIDKYNGTILQAIHQQQHTRTQSLVCLKGIREIKIPAARGIRKEDLTTVEKMIKDVIDIMNKWKPFFIQNINANIFSANGLIGGINGIIFSLNGIIGSIRLLVETINLVIRGLNKLGANINEVSTDNLNGIGYITPMEMISDENFPDSSFIDNREGALMLENDFVNTPKLLLIQTERIEFTQERIAFLRNNNQDVINAKYLWDNFYFIDSFVGKNHNRFTKISPALNKDSDKNPITLSVSDFKTLVSNPKIKDNFGEEIITDSIQWYIEQNGKADISFRKRGWLKNPQSSNGAKRAEEINVNLQIKTSLPNGQ